MAQAMQNACHLGPYVLILLIPLFLLIVVLVIILGHRA